MKKTTLTSVGALLCLYFSSIAQPPPAPRPLTVGDTLPDSMLTDSYWKHSVNTLFPRKDNKVTVLYFFASWCQPCIRKMPLLDTLWQRNRQWLQIVAVTYEEEAVLEKLSTRHSDFSRLQLPVIYKDTLLTRYFRHRILPHVVWIYNGIVAAITTANEISNENLNHLAAYGQLKLPLKEDRMEFDRNEPLLQHNNAGTFSDIAAQFNFTRYRPGIPSGAGYNYMRDSSLKRIYYLNKSLPALYKAATTSLPAPHKKRRSIVYPPGYEFTQQDKYEEWAAKRAYCLELIIPAHTPAYLWRKAMLAFLEINAPLQMTLTDTTVLLTEKNNTCDTYLY